MATRAVSWRCLAVARCAVSKPCRRTATTTAVAVDAPPASRQKPVSAAGPPPGVDATQLCGSAAEVAAVCVPGKVTGVTQTDSTTCVLFLRTPTTPARACVWLCWHPVAGRLALGPPPTPASRQGSDSAALSWGAVLHAQLQGSALVECSLPTPGERVVRLTFAPRPGEAASHAVVLEALGAHANAFLLTLPDGVIRACGYQTGRQHTRQRTLATGDVYTPPPLTRGGLASMPWREAACHAAAAAQGKGQRSVAAAIVRCLAGASPTLAEALCLEADVPPQGVSPDQLSDEQWTRLAAAAAQWQAALLNNDVAALRPGRWGIPTADEPHLAQSGVDDGGYASRPIGDALHARHASFAASSGLRARRDALLASVRAACKKERGKISHFKTALEGTAQADTLRLNADLLLSQLHVVTAGASEARITDWATGEELVLPLDPAQSALANAQRMHTRAKKLARGVAQCGPMLEKAAAELAWLEDIEQQLTGLALEAHGASDDLVDEEEAKLLGDIHAELLDAKLVKPLAGQSGEQKKGGRGGAKTTSNASASSSSAGVRRFRTASGLDVFVGRHNRGNETVSHSLSKDGDVWFHARGVPGAHVVLKLPAGREAQDADMQFCADLAAFFSRERGATKTAVSYTDPKHLKRAPGGRLGAVIMTQERVWTGRPGDGQKVAAAAAMLKVFHLPLGPIAALVTASTEDFKTEEAKPGVKSRTLNSRPLTAAAEKLLGRISDSEHRYKLINTLFKHISYTAAQDSSTNRELDFNSTPSKVGDLILRLRLSHETDNGVLAGANTGISWTEDASAQEILEVRVASTSPAVSTLTVLFHGAPAGIHYVIDVADLRTHPTCILNNVYDLLVKETGNCTSITTTVNQFTFSQFAVVYRAISDLPIHLSMLHAGREVLDFFGILKEPHQREDFSPGAS